jgi:hypothetical protein
MMMFWYLTVPSVQTAGGPLVTPSKAAPTKACPSSVTESLRKKFGGAPYTNVCVVLLRLSRVFYEGSCKTLDVWCRARSNDPSINEITIGEILSEDAGHLLGGVNYGGELADIQEANSDGLVPMEERAVTSSVAIHSRVYSLRAGIKSANDHEVSSGTRPSRFRCLLQDRLEVPSSSTILVCDLVGPNVARTDKATTIELLENFG